MNSDFKLVITNMLYCIVFKFLNNNYYEGMFRVYVVLVVKKLINEQVI